MLNVFLLLILTLVATVYFYYKKRTGYWHDAGIPHIEAEFPFRSFFGKYPRLHFAERLQSSYNKLRDMQPGLLYGGVYAFVTPMVLVVDLDFLKTILVKDFQYFHDRGLYYNEEDDPLSAHLLNIEGSRWKNLRAKLTPTFSSGKMKMMLPTIINVAGQFEEYMAKTVTETNVIEMKDLLARFTTDVIGTCAFGLDCNSMKDPDTEFRKMGKKAFAEPRNGPARRLFTITFRKLAKRFHMKLIHDDVAAFFLGVVRDTIEYREKNNVQRNDFMNLLIQLKNTGSLDEESAKKPSPNSVGYLTTNEIAAQAFIFFLAGFETSSTAMSYALYELSMNMEIQEKARKCVRDTLKKHDGKWTYEAVSEMNYIDQCINESLRKYPPASNIIRKTTKDYHVAETNHVIKQGLTVLIAVYGIHHDPKYYPDPERYDPDRFLPEEVSKRHPFAFLPFGEGPRICIGLRFGMMQARIGLATLLNSFKFTPCSKSVIPLKFDASSFILTSEGGLFLNVEKI